MSFNMYVPTRILFGLGAVKKLHEQEFPGKKAVIVISNGKSTKENGYLDTVKSEMSKAGVETVVFDKIQPNPLKATAEEGGKFARENNCDGRVKSNSCFSN